MSQSSNRTQLNESLSVLVDDEASEMEIHRLLLAAQQDPEIRERWHRHQLARAAMQGEVIGSASMDFADRIRDAVSGIEFDEQVESSPKSEPRRWKSNLGRAAVAASVAAVVLVGAQQLQLAGYGADGQEEFAQQTPEALPVAPSSINIPAISLQNVSGGDVLPNSQLPRGLEYAPSIQQQQSQDDQIRRYIHRLMLEHAESAAQNSGSGLMPYARVPAGEER